MESDVAHMILWQYGRTAFAVISPTNTRGRDAVTRPATHQELTSVGLSAEPFIFNSCDGSMEKVSLSSC